MIGLDTNVLVRYLTQDNPDHSAQATRLMEHLDEDNQGFISLVTLVELYWVLRRAHKVSRDVATDVVSKLMDAQELVVQEPDIVRRALTRLTPEADFPNALINELGQAVGCVHTATFDHRASSLPGMTLVPALQENPADLGSADS